MTATLNRAAAPQTLLSSRTLPRWSWPTLLAADIGVSAALFAVTPLQGRAQFVLFVAATYVVALTALSAVYEGSHKWRDRLAASLTTAALVLAIVPLVAVLGYTISRGIGRFDGTFFYHSMNNIANQDAGGGAYHAIVGTLEQVGIATLIAVPFGLLVSIYLVEYGRGRFRRIVSTCVDVMTGLPSIVAGLFILAVWVLFLGQGYSGFAGSLALVILMLPVVVRTCEEVLQLVPDALREGSYALGVTRWRTVMSVVLPAALPGISTAVMLAIARATGETAPLLLTVFGSPSINFNPFSGPQEGLPLFVFSQAGLPNGTALDRAWAGALTLIAIVIVLNIAARLLIQRAARR